MYDAINAENLPVGGDLYAGYIDGHYNDYAAIKARFPNTLVVSIATNPSSKAIIGDGPPDNGTWPEWVQWTTNMRAQGIDPWMNTNVSNWAAGKAAYATAGVAEPHWWIAHYDNDPTLPAGAGMKQYASNSLYDTSVCADYLPGIDPAPVVVPPTTSEEDDELSTQSVDGQVDIAWSTGSKHVVEVAFDGAGQNNGVTPSLRVVLLLDSGPLVLNSDWQPTVSARTVDFSAHQANAYGISLQAVGTQARYAAYVA